MRWRFWLAAAGGMAAGYGWFQWFQRSIDGKMRRDIGAPVTPGVGQRPNQAASAAPPAPEATAAKSLSGTSLQTESILLAVREHPGILQTELYSRFPGESRRVLQDLLLQLDREGSLRREREGNTYRLQIAGKEKTKKAKGGSRPN